MLEYPSILEHIERFIIRIYRKRLIFKLYAWTIIEDGPWY